MRQSTTGTLLVLGAAAGFGTIGIFGELALAVDLPLATLLPVRFALATTIVLLIGSVRGWSLPSSGRQWGVTLALGVLYTAMTLAYFSSLEFLTAGFSTIVLYTYPAFVVVLSVLVLRERVTGRTVLALACSLVGVALAVGIDLGAAGGVGVALALGAAFCYAVYTAGSRRVVASVPPRALMLGALVGTTVSMSAFGAVSGGLALPAGVTEWGIVVGLAIVGTVAPLVLYYEGVERLEASRVGIVSTAEPVVTVLLGALILDQPVTPGLAVGGALVLAGVILVQRTRQAGRPPSEPDWTVGEDG